MSVLIEVEAERFVDSAWLPPDMVMIFQHSDGRMWAVRAGKGQVSVPSRGVIRIDYDAGKEVAKSE